MSCDRTLPEIADYFRTHGYATVNWNCRVVESKIAKEMKFKDRIERSQLTLVNSRPSTLAMNRSKQGGYGYKIIIAVWLVALAFVSFLADGQPEQTTRFRLAKEHAFLPCQYFLIFVPNRLSAIRLSRNLSTQNYRNTTSRGAAPPHLGKPKFPRMGIDITGIATAISAG
jgi:hypothetical protein